MSRPSVLNIAYYEDGASDRSRGDPAARLSLRHPHLCGCCADPCREGLPRHRSLSARLWRNALSRCGDAALGRAGRARRRRDRADRCARDQARGVRRPQLGRARGHRRRGAVAGSLRRPRHRQLLSDPGSVARHGAVSARERRGDVVRILFPARARPRRARRQPAQDRADAVGGMVAGLGFRRRHLRSLDARARQSRFCRCR